jgi:hypothetical protein
MGCFPGEKKGLLYLLTVVGLALALDGLLVILSMIEEHDGMLARVAGPFRKCIQQQGFLARRCLLIAWYQRPEQCAPTLKGLGNVLWHDERFSLQATRSPSEKEGKEMRQRAEWQQNTYVFCVPALLSRSNALAVSSVTQTDDWWPKPQLYEKSYPAPHESNPSPCSCPVLDA